MPSILLGHSVCVAFMMSPCSSASPEEKLGPEACRLLPDVPRSLSISAFKACRADVARGAVASLEPHRHLLVTRTFVAWSCGYYLPCALDLELQEDITAHFGHPELQGLAQCLG